MQGLGSHRGSDILSEGRISGNVDSYLFNKMLCTQRERREMLRIVSRGGGTRILHQVFLFHAK